MYWLTPFKYLLEGFLALLLSGQEIRCDTKELAIFPPPPGQDCQSYAGQFAQQSGGYVQTQPDGNCGYCQYATGDAFAASFNVFPKYIWRDFGMCDLCCIEEECLANCCRNHVDIHLLQLRGRFHMYISISWRYAQDRVRFQAFSEESEGGREKEAEWRQGVEFGVLLELGVEL
jgi:hypothetical protein